jgi:hypothetical protein
MMDEQYKKETLESWDKWLDEWMKDIYPTFQKHGLSKDTAIIIYRLNMVGNEVAQLGEPEKEDWEG